MIKKDDSVSKWKERPDTSAEIPEDFFKKDGLIRGLWEINYYSAMKNPLNKLRFKKQMVKNYRK